MKFITPGIAAAVAVCVCSSAATAQDTYTAGAVIGVLEDTGLPSADPDDVEILAAGAFTIPGTTPVVNGGNANLMSLLEIGFSDLYSNVSTSFGSNTAMVTIEFGMNSGNAFTDLWADISTELPSGNMANAMLFDIGNATGTGAPLFPIDGIEVGAEWTLAGATQSLYNAGGEFSSGAFDPVPGLPTPFLDNFYFAGGFDFETLESTGMNKVVWEIELNLVPAPGAMALLGIAGLAGRRRRR
ncbi:MAG: hypothetical protein MK085_04290 [Phycisphaerales bacterium]|nr:hypothetical protein [Phycisphaerales bacterium]